ncbi:hypothetical protein [Sediminitomix flava]|uniref:YD repeat-containing protein n=1 Tax=Sediminitomix flava TaxID=379075 RepID=A0A315ZHQ2_SEDFL|nr:hypothetical protein [Sediminitomix flava]PWJ44743.1 YD repeat-containing protein [Sediminitomix flava]
MKSHLRIHFLLFLLGLLTFSCDSQDDDGTTVNNSTSVDCKLQGYTNNYNEVFDNDSYSDSEVFTYTYNSDGQLISVDERDATDSTDFSTHTLSYDTDGNLISYQEGDDYQMILSYDANGRLESITEQEHSTPRKSNARLHQALFSKLANNNARKAATSDDDYSLEFFYNDGENLPFKAESSSDDTEVILYTFNSDKELTQMEVSFSGGNDDNETWAGTETITFTYGDKSSPVSGLFKNPVISSPFGSMFIDLIDFDILSYKKNLSSVSSVGSETYNDVTENWNEVYNYIYTYDSLTELPSSISISQTADWGNWSEEYVFEYDCQ